MAKYSRDELRQMAEAYLQAKAIDPGDLRVHNLLTKLSQETGLSRAECEARIAFLSL